MLEVPILFYLIVCLVNFIFDKARIIWFLAFIYFVINIRTEDSINYFIIEYILQSFILVLFGLLFYENKIKMLICFSLAIISIINLICYLYPALLPVITSIFIQATDRFYFETLLLIPCTFMDIKTTIISFINIGLVIISYLITGV